MQIFPTEKTLKIFWTYICLIVKNFPYIHFHGGGLDHGTKGDTEVPESFVEANKSIAVASAEYRKYPDAKYSEYTEYAANTVAYNRKTLNFDKLIICQ